MYRRIALIINLFAILNLARPAVAQTPPTHEVRALATGKVMTCVCTVVGDELHCASSACLDKPAAAEPNIRLTAPAPSNRDMLPGDNTALWQQLVGKLLRDEAITRHVRSLGIEPRFSRGSSRANMGYGANLTIECAAYPGQIYEEDTGAGAMQESVFIGYVREEVQRTCAPDPRSLAILGALGDRRSKFRFSPGNGGQLLQTALWQLYADEAINASAAELVFDAYPPVDNPRGKNFWPLYRAEIRTLRCIKAPEKRHTAKAPEQPVEVDEFRRWVRGEVEKACGS